MTRLKQKTEYFFIFKNAHFCTKRCKGVRFFCVSLAISDINRPFIVQNSVKLCSIREKIRLFCRKYRKIAVFH